MFPGLMKGDGPYAAMAKKKMENYSSTGVAGLKYPADLGRADGETHSYINFRAVKRNEVSHEPSVVTSSSGVTPQANISLYIPENVGVTQTANYEQTQGLAAAALTGQINGVGDTMSLLGDTIVREAADLVLNNAGELYKQINDGQASNASRYQLFRGVEYRTFQFQYKFVAKSTEDSQNIEQITRTFRKHMLPDLSNALFYTIPDIFEIEYRILDSSGGQKTLHQFKPSALTSCEISYGADGSFGIFHDGSPTNVQMNLTFLELYQVLKTDVDGGF